MTLVVFCYCGVRLGQLKWRVRSKLEGVMQLFLGGCVMLDKKKSMRGYIQDRRLQWFGHLERTFVVGDSFNKDEWEKHEVI